MHCYVSTLTFSNGACFAAAFLCGVGHEGTVGVPSDLERIRDHNTAGEHECDRRDCNSHHAAQLLMDREIAQQSL